MAGIEPMEVDAEPISQVSEALRIIEDVSEFSSKVLVNKHQCGLLADRVVHGIGGTLKEVPKEMPKEMVCSRQTLVDAGNVNSPKMDFPAFEMLLTVLRKAKALLWKYMESRESISSVLTRTDDREAFKEIHGDLDMLHSQFHFDESIENGASESRRTAMLTGAADEDKSKLSETLDEVVQSDVTLLSTNLETMKLVVTEKSSGGSDHGLPSYLNIDPASVEIKEEVRPAVRNSDHDPLHTDNDVRVQFGRYLDCEFALKVFKSGDPKWNTSEHLKEVRSLMALHHPHVVQLMGFAQDRQKCIVLMELMDTDLRHLMIQYRRSSSQGRRPFTRAVEMDIITQIARAMYYLHEQGYVHGELKCSNILVKRIGDHIDVKVSDLRSSQKLGANWDPVLFKENSKRRRPRWTAPELEGYCESHHVTDDLLKKTDVYSFGMVCYEVLTGKLPFQDIQGEPLKRLIETGKLKQELPGELDENLRGLIESCWSRDPNDRPTFGEICHLLNDIRCSQRPVSILSVGIGTFMRHIQQIPLILRYFPTVRTASPVDVTTWKRESTHDADQDGQQESTTHVLTLPEFVRIEPSKLKTQREIGKGAYGKLYEVTWLGCKYAVKTFMSKSPPTEVQKELKFLVELRHPSIVRLMGLAVHSERRCSIVMEFMGSDLRHLINSCTKKRKSFMNPQVVPFDLHDAVYIIRKIALGMAFLHSRGVIHRGLNAGNVLVPDQPGSIDVKITDFGVSHLMDSSEKPTTVAGTSFWRAPELFERQAAEHVSIDLKATDVYSFAMTSYEVLTGRLPLEDQIEVYGSAAAVRLAVIGEGLRPELPSDLNPGLKLLIEECWNGNPGKRPTFSSICQRLQTIQQGLHCS